MRENKDVSIAEMKNNLSQYVAESFVKGTRFVITKRNKPVAALVHIEDLKIVEQHREREGLLQAIGKWKNFEEVAKPIKDPSKLRKEMDRAGKLPL
jgi:prevent-host-death family protein